MKDVIDVVEQHTNNEITEYAVQGSLVLLAYIGLAYCVSLLV